MGGALSWSPAYAAVSNLIPNPSAAGNSVKDWIVAPSGWGPLTATTVNGVAWFHWVSDNVQSHQPGPGSAWQSALIGSPSPGEQVSCGFQAMGQGVINEVMWTGAGNATSKSITLSSTPQIVSETTTIAPQTGGKWPVSNPLVEVDYTNQTGNLNIYFNDVTCVQGASVTLVANTTVATATTSSSTAATSTTSTSTSQTTPKTGSGPWPFVGGMLALAAGVGLLTRRRSRYQ